MDQENNAVFDLGKIFSLVCGERLRHELLRFTSASTFLGHLNQVLDAAETR